MPAGPVAVIDIGSNSIKVLVAARRADGRITSLLGHTVEARISAGLSAAEPSLGAEGMARGLAAVQELLALAAPFAPAQTVLVATSAVRGARNGDEFRAQVLAATGHEVRVLTGDEEANFIGRGLTCDPALAHLEDFFEFDLGGGSLECLEFIAREVRQAVSLPLGCVRLTEKLGRETPAGVPAEVLAAVRAHTTAALAGSAFRFAPPGAVAVFAGGTMTAARAILGARTRLKMKDAPAVLSCDTLEALLREVAALPLAARHALPGMPPGRADVFPTALATALAVAEAGGFTAFHHSLYNLRWGLAATLLEAATH